MSAEIIKLLRPANKESAKSTLKRAGTSIAVFVDGVNLDRATKRLKRRVSLENLLKGVSSGVVAQEAHYYTVIPNEDDARQLSFLDAVEQAGYTVTVKRLPPKGITRQISCDAELATDICKFALSGRHSPSENNQDHSKAGSTKDVVLVCPSRDMLYTVNVLVELGIHVAVADFGDAASKELLGAASEWLDLADSETIWR